MKQFPQDSGSGLQDQNNHDYGDAAHLGALAHSGPQGILTGCGIVSTDFTVPNVTVDGGEVRIVDTSVDARDHSGDGTADTTWPEVVQVYRIEQTTVTLTDAAVNELYVQGDQSSPDNASVVATSDGLAPSGPTIKIGEVDTSADSVSEQFNKIEDDGTLSFPDADSANGALSSLPDGVGVIDRANKVLIYDDKVSVATLEADAIVDGSDVSHSGELADIADVSPIQSSSDITVTDTQVGTVGDGEFLTNSGGSLTGGTVQTEPNIPGFEKDPNNPIGGSLSTSHTITLSKSYKFIKVIVLDFDPLANRTDLFMRINGISTDTYDVRDKSGSSTFGANKIKLSRMNDDFVAPSGEIHINGATTDVAGIGGQNFVHSNEFVTDRADEFGIQNTEGSDVNSIELFTTTGDQFNPTVRVYGLN